MDIGSGKALPNREAAVAELADAHDSKSCGKPYGFDSHQRHYEIRIRFYLRRIRFFYPNVHN